MREKGKSEEEIAAAFFVSPAVVQQRLRLAAVSPTLLDLYADDGMTLEQLMAFTVNPDHQRQEQVWEALKNGYTTRALPDPPPADRRRRPRRRQAGAVRRHRGLRSGGRHHPARSLLRRRRRRLAAGRRPARSPRRREARASAAELRGEGWKWIEVALDFPYGHTFGLRRLSGERTSLTEDGAGAYDALKAEFDRLEEEYDGAEELPEEVDRRLGEIEAALEAFESAARRATRPTRSPAPASSSASIPPASSASNAAMSGPKTSRQRGIDDDRRGGDRSTAQGSGLGMPRDAAIDSHAADARTPDDDEGRPLSDRLITELTTFRTLALARGAARDRRTSPSSRRCTPWPHDLLSLARRQLPR